MAITPDVRTPGAATLAGNATGATSMSWTHTLGAALTAGILLAQVSQDAGAASTSAVWDSGGTNAGMTLKTPSAVTGTCRAEHWYLKAPAVSGAKTILVSWSGSHDGNAGSSSYSGVDQATTFNAASAQTATGLNNTSASLAVTSANGEMVIDALVIDLIASGLTPTKGASQTVIAAGNNSGGTAIASGASDQASVGASVTMTWTIVAGQGAWAQTGISLIPATSSSSGTTQRSGRPFPYKPGSPGR